MPDATPFARQWAGLVAQARLLGTHAERASLIEADGMVAAIVPAAPTSSVINCALCIDPAGVPSGLDEIAARYRAGRAAKWGLWVDGEDERAARAAVAQGMLLDSRPAPMVARLDALPFDDAPARGEADLATIGRVNDIAYASPEPKIEPAISALPPDALLSYSAAGAEGETASVAIGCDLGDDTVVWFVATLPEAQRRGLAGAVLRRLLLDARERGQRTASLQASPAGRPLYERLGFESVGALHLYEERFS
jgi:GNAT superfamily N-acetyltransferase